MVFRNSILSIFRSKAKTALFTLLIFSLTLAFALGVSVWASIAQFLNDCDDFYTTIGLVEYIGTNYPNDSVYDPMMSDALSSFNLAAIAEDEATMLWDPQARSLGYIQGFRRSDLFVPDRMLSVFVIGHVNFNTQHDAYSGIVADVLYSSNVRNNTVVYIDKDFGEFEPGHYYLVFGEAYYQKSPLLHLRAFDYNNSLALASGVVVPRMIDVTSQEGDRQIFTLPADSIFQQVADSLRVTNNSVLVNQTDNLLAMLPFQQEEMYFIEGRAFNEDEYKQGRQVIILSELIATQLGISVGDNIDLSVAVSDQPGIYNSYWVDEGFAYEGTFTVIGITNTVNDKSWYVYVPKSVGIPSSPFPVGYTLGQAVIRNEEAAKFYTRIDPVLADRFQVTMYDQGYSDVAVPFQTVLSVAKIVTAVCALMVLAVLILFGFVFVYRQRETAETMLLLVAGKLRVIKYFFFSAGLISLIATISGSLAAFWMHDDIIAVVARTAERYTLVDSRYSNGNLTISRILEFAPHLGNDLFIYVALAVFLLAIISSLAFAAGTFIQRRAKKQKVLVPRREYKTSRMGGGSLKYAILSIIRGGARSLVVPLLSITVVIFLGQLATTSLHYQEQLEAIYDNTTIDGYFTDINGKQIGNQVLNAYDVSNMFHSGQLSNLFVSLNQPYYFFGIAQLADGTDMELGPLYVPDNQYAYESLRTEISRGPGLTSTNNIRQSPEFFFADDVLMNFMEGYDESFLTKPESGDSEFTCIIPTSLMEQRGIELGDTIRVVIDRDFMSPQYDARIFVHIDLRVVGSYEKQGVQDTVYTPLALFFDPSLVWGADNAAVGPPIETVETGYLMTEAQKEILQTTTLNSVNFSLKDARDLVSFKDYLADYGYSQVHNVSRVREFIILRDAVFNSAVASIKQQIRYIDVLHPVLYVLVGIIAMVISYLLVVSRKREFGTMCALGATRTRSFLSFFFEQAILSIAGTAIGLLIWLFVWGNPSQLHMILTLGFLICYFLGSAISITIMSHTNVLTILADKD